MAAVTPRSALAGIAQHDLGGGVLAPGFIDVQVNGGGGVLLNEDPSLAGVKAIACAHRRFGTVGMLPTVITDAPSVIAAAVDAGVSSYIVDGLKKDRIKHILDISISRFNAFSRISTELEQTKSALEERKVIDRAKGILMKRKGLSEDEAYALLRATAQNEKKKIADIAQSIITAAELFK